MCLNLDTITSFIMHYLGESFRSGSPKGLLLSGSPKSAKRSLGKRYEIEKTEPSVFGVLVQPVFREQFDGVQTEFTITSEPIRSESELVATSIVRFRNSEERH